MPVASTTTVALRGLSGDLVRIEADLSTGLPGLAFTGLAGTSVTEARDRIRAAVVNSGGIWPSRRITLALLPADVPKRGSHFDLAMALAVLAASGTVPARAVETTVWLAELGLDGALRPVRGVLPAVVAARAAGCPSVVVAHGNAAEAALVGGIEVRSAATLGHVVEALLDPSVTLPLAVPSAVPPAPPRIPDLADVAGQTLARKGIEVAAAGGHHLLLSGVPGAGKTMLAERLPGLLPALSDDAALELTAIHSVAGRLAASAGLLRHAPFEAPHHSATVASVVGGGSHIAAPGAISLAHRGILFLDEAPQFDAHTLDALRQPLESGRVTVSRAGGSVTYPARFLLVMAMNPCPCGRDGRECECLPAARRRYAERLSRPLLDRVDIRMWVDPVARHELFHDPALGETSEPTVVVAARVAVARAAAAQRWAPMGWATNAEAEGPVLRRRPWRPAPSVMRSAEAHLDAGRMSARGFDRVLRLSWTLADLSGRASPTADLMDEALYLRAGRDQAWAA